MTLSSRNVIKDWKAETVRVFIPPPSKSAPSIKDLTREILQEWQDQPNATSDMEDARRETAASQQPQDELNKTAEQMEEMLAEAQRQAEEILQNAREQAEQIREDAQREGFIQGESEGREEGMQQAQKELEDAKKEHEQIVLQELTRALEEIDKTKERCLRNYLDELRDISIAVAEKVIHTSLETSGDIIKRMIIFETEKLKKTAWVKIYMEKMDYDMMMKADANLVAELSKLSDNIKFVVMEKEERGSCIIETPEEIMDIGVGTQMENIREIAETIRA